MQHIMGANTSLILYFSDAKSIVYVIFAKLFAVDFCEKCGIKYTREIYEYIVHLYASDYQINLFCD